MKHFHLNISKISSWKINEKLCWHLKLVRSGCVRTPSVWDLSCDGC